MVSQTKPVTVILVWIILIGGALTLPTPQLVTASAILFSVAFVVARKRLKKILFRSRWLLLSLIVLFGWATPGTQIPWTFGASYEGAGLAVDQLGRLVISLAGVAILMRILDSASLVSGLRELSMPFRYIGIDQDRFAVRLTLTLNLIDCGKLDSSYPYLVLTGADSRHHLSGVEKIDIPAARWGLADGVLFYFCAVAIGLWWSLR